MKPAADPADFDPAALRKGIAVELEHTDDEELAQVITIHHLMEDRLYYDKLETIDPHHGGALRPNRRVKTYEAYDIAKNMRETFVDRPVEWRETVDFKWPALMQGVGDSLAVAYASDKWTKKNSSGTRELELYKHLAESRNRALAMPEVLYDFFDPSSAWTVIGPPVDIASCPMPKHFAALGLFEEIDLKLHTAGTDENPRFGRSKDAGVVHVSVKNGYLGGSKILWSRIDPNRNDEPFIFVYTKTDGVMFMVTGEKLDIEKDGIVG